MGDRLVSYCDRHPDSPLEEWDPMMGDGNAQPVAIVFADSTHELRSCRRCVAELRAFVGPRPPDSYSGTVRGADKMRYAPRLDGPTPIKKWQLLPTLEPPEFQS